MNDIPLITQFAMAALSVVNTNNEFDSPRSSQAIAQDAFSIADAMMVEHQLRKKNPQPTRYAKPIIQPQEE